jgi:signal transduction histidine kinase
VRSNRHLEVEIGDDGVGIVPSHAPRATPGSFGLISMRERAEVLGGSLRVDSEPGHGTRVIVNVPLESVHRNKEHAGSSDVAAAAG